ncbi:MAG TPA: helix-turn-helix domain-containing protein [Nocardioides sp.]|nr:helix-turn-helix domain-containing protein [Nocardioides sp.]
MRLTGALADRGTWVTQGDCPIEKAMTVVGSRNAMLVMREAFYGTSRFDDFAERVGMSPATTAAKLRSLVEAGLLAKTPYREEGARTREEYTLTAAGTDLMPVVFGLFDWGMRHCAEPPPLQLRHHDCDEPVTVALVCDGGHVVPSGDVDLRVRRHRSH